MKFGEYNSMRGLSGNEDAVLSGKTLCGKILFNSKGYVAFVPFVVAAFGFILRISDKNIYNDLFGHEAGITYAIAEKAQFVLYLLSCISSVTVLRKIKYIPYPATSRVLVVLLASLTFFVAMEEISWGQQIFGWSTPEGWENMNLQKETTLHDLALFQSVHPSILPGLSGLHLAYVCIGLFGGLGWIARNKYAFKRLHSILVPFPISTFFSVPACYYILLILGMVHVKAQELFETILAAGFFLHSWYNLASFESRHRL